MSVAAFPPGIKVTLSRQFRRCGKPACSACSEGSPGHGPYWYAYWRDGGRVRSRYVGKNVPLGLRESADLANHSQATPREQDLGTFLTIRTLGRFEVRRGDKIISYPGWLRRRPESLLKALLAATGQHVLRDELIEWLWPDASIETASHNLSATLYILRKALDVAGHDLSFVRSGGNAIALVPSLSGRAEPGWLDADEFAGAAVSATASMDIGCCRAALAIYQGDFLPDDPYIECLSARRDDLRQKYVALLLHTATLAARMGEQQEAIGLVEQLLTKDNCNEGAAQLLLRLRAASGQHTEGLRAYHRLSRALAEQLNVAPAETTRALYRRLLAARRAPTYMAQQVDLPEMASEFVGRDRELDTVGRLLADLKYRAVTLTGLGGCGKTRLALKAAQSLSEKFEHRVWFVELSAVQDGKLVLHAIGESLALRENVEGYSAYGANEPMLALISAALHGSRALLVLDNCEHVVAAAAYCVAALLRTCPLLSVLSTSREALGIDLEFPFLVGPLVVPGESARGDIQSLMQNDAVRLFVTRAQSVRPDYELTTENSHTVVRICRHLEGIPLAIELAAARLSMLSDGQLAERLDDRFKLLTGGARGKLQRHQTLEATMDWSYSLLTPAEQLLLQRLTVFSGGWSLEAAEAVCDGPTLGAASTLTLLSQLVAKSVAIRLPDHQERSEARFTMLETVRQYAMKHVMALSEDGGAHGPQATVSDRHLNWCVELAEDAYKARAGAAQREWLDRLDVEHDNFRCALRRATDADKAAWETVVLGVRLCAALGWFWEVRGYLTEGREWLAAAFAAAECHDSPVPRAVVLAAMYEAGGLATSQGDLKAAATSFKRALAIARHGQDPFDIARALDRLGMVAGTRGDHAAATDLYSESVSIWRDLGDWRGLSLALDNGGHVAQALGAFDKALDRFTESLELKRRNGDQLGLAESLNLLGLVAYDQGDNERATLLFEEALAIVGALGNRYGVAHCWGNLGLAAYGRQDNVLAEQLHLKSLSEHIHIGDQIGVAWALEGLAGVARATGRMVRSAKLFGAVQALREMIDAPLSPIDQRTYEQGVESVRYALGPIEFGRHWDVGLAMSMEAAAAYALSVDAGS